MNLSIPTARDVMGRSRRPPGGGESLDALDNRSILTHHGRRRFRLPINFPLAEFPLQVFGASYLDHSEVWRPILSSSQAKRRVSIPLRSMPIARSLLSPHSRDALWKACTCKSPIITLSSHVACYQAWREGSSARTILGGSENHFIPRG